MENQMKELEERIKQIEMRNRKVELDKSWEVSICRKVFIIVLTYVFAVLYLEIADTTNPFFGAVVPCAGFYLSTQSLKLIKEVWLKRKK